MVQQKIRVGVLFGGKSAEHEISLLSAKSVAEALDKDKYDPIFIGIDKAGEWHVCEAIDFCKKESSALSIAHLSRTYSIDVVFPVLHGTYGEDGTVQGLLKMADIPFVGSGVLGSAVGMDKDVMKRLLREAQIPTAKFILLTRKNKKQWDFDQVVREVGLPFFVKPANLGSSVGISKVKHQHDFEKALSYAFEYDHKVVVEEYIRGREIECAVLGNDFPKASLPGEVIPLHEFYSYEAKYLDPNGAKFQIPVLLDAKVIEKIQETAVKAYQALCCEGMARIDFFLKECGELYVNEVNTIPGFTTISMYPKMWVASGLPYASLLDELIQLALERFKQDKTLKTTF